MQTSVTGHSRLAALCEQTFRPVWPYWVVFQSSWRQIYVQKLHKCNATFRASLKSITLLAITAMANFGATFGKFRATLYIDIWSHCALRPNPFYERINMGQKCYEELDTIS